MTTPALTQDSDGDFATGPSEPDVLPEAVMRAIFSALQGLRFGQVTLIVHDGRVMQIDRTDRLRLQATDARP